MRDDKFFLYPKYDWQKRYEALRASFVDRLPAKAVAEKFGYSESYINLLRHQFIHGKIDLSEPIPEGKSRRRRIDNKTRSKIRDWRERNLSAGDIAQLLYEDGVNISVRTVERILAEEGFPKLPRRTRLKIGRTVKGADVPSVSEKIEIKEIEKEQFDCDSAGAFLFAPFIEKLNVNKIIKDAGLPGTKVIPAINYFMSFLGLTNQVISV